MKSVSRGAVLCAALALCAGCRPGRLTFLSLEAEGCARAPQSKTVTIYDCAEIGPDTGVSTGAYIPVDGYRHANIFVEFEQHESGEKPLSLGVVFAPDPGGRCGARRYFNFEENFSGMADPRMITLTGEKSWHGSPHDKSSYVARLPVMGPYLQVFPYNHHAGARKFSVILYLTE